MISVEEPDRANTRILPKPLAHILLQPLEGRIPHLRWNRCSETCTEASLCSGSAPHLVVSESSNTCVDTENIMLSALLQGGGYCWSSIFFLCSLATTINTCLVPSGTTFSINITYPIYDFNATYYYSYNNHSNNTTSSTININTTQETGVRESHELRKLKNLPPSVERNFASGILHEAY